MKFVFYVENTQPEQLFFFHQPLSFILFYFQGMGITGSMLTMTAKEQPLITDI